MNLYTSLQRVYKELDYSLGKAGKTREDITVLFATKYLSAQEFVSFLDITKQFDIDNCVIGENRVQDWEKKLGFIKEKRPELLSAFTPVMIGTLQKNKVNKALQIFQEIHSVDSVKLAQTIDKRVEKGRRVSIYLEVNVSGEERKHGFSPNDIYDAIETMKQLNNVTIEGFMTMAPLTDNIEEIRGIFRKLKELANQYKLKTSMGMSGDWKIAVEEGSDMVRIGSAVFA